MDKLKAPGKPFEISKQAVWEAWEKVKANKGAPGVDAVTVEEFESDLKNNLYKIWNRLSSGTWFPPPVRAVEIPKPPHGGGTKYSARTPVADRVAQTVVAGVIEARAEPVFHPDSYGYRPGRSALDAVAVCRRRCWEADWVIDLDIRKFFDTMPWDLAVKAVQAVTDLPWVVLYVRRWLAAPLALPARIAAAVRYDDGGQSRRSGDDADQIGRSRRCHRMPLDPPVVHEPGGVLDRVLRADRHDRGRHQVARGDPACLGLIPTVQDATEHARLVGQGLLGQHVGLGDDPDHLPVVVDHGERADAVLAQGGGHLAERGVLLDSRSPGWS